MNKRHYEHTLPNIRGSLSNTYVHFHVFDSFGLYIRFTSGHACTFGPAAALLRLLSLLLGIGHDIPL